jgi:uncharacterized protein
MTQPAKSQEPSMEEILASIRRIIADDDANKTAQRAAPEPPPPPSPPPPRPAPRPAAVAPRPMAPPPLPEPSEPESYDESAEPIAEEPAEDNAADILDLTESMTTPAFEPEPPPMPAPPAQFRKVDGHGENGYDAQPSPALFGRDAADREARLLSSATSAAVDSAFNTLAQTVLVQNARTLEDLVREMLRPMLKSWLDDNLPGMVERLVRAEIERVARGR